MELAKVLKRVLANYNGGTRLDVLKSILNEMREDSTADIEACHAILFIEDGTFKYRKVFEVDIRNETVYNTYGFRTRWDNVIPYDGSDVSYVKNTLNEFISKFNFEKQKEGSKMNIKNNSTVSKMIEVNKASAINAGKIELGKSANRLVLNKVKPQLPMMVRGYADSPIAELVIGNIVAGLLIQFAGDNKKAQILSDAMIAAGAQVAIESFDIPNLVKELLDNVTIPVEDVQS